MKRLFGRGKSSPKVSDKRSEEVAVERSEVNGVNFVFLGQHDLDEKIERGLDVIHKIFEDAKYRVFPTTLTRDVQGHVFTYRLLFDSYENMAHLQTHTSRSQDLTFLYFALYPDPSNQSPDVQTYRRAAEAVHTEIAPDGGIYQAELKHFPAEGVALPTVANYQRGGHF